MTFELGINVDPGHWATDLGAPVDLIAADGFRSARNALILGREAEYQEYERLLEARGIIPLRCLTGQSFTPDEVAAENFKDRVGWWNDKLGIVRGRWEAGNEPEEGGGDASWTLSKERFGALLTQTREALGTDAFLVSGGLVRGDPNWLSDVPGIEVCTAKGIHFYEMRPELNWPDPDWGHGALHYPLAAMKATFDRDGIPWAVTEFGGHRRLFRDENQRAEFHKRTLERLALADFVGWALVFGLDAVMNPDYGLREDGQPLRSYTVCVEFLKGIVKPVLGGGHAVGQTLEQFMAENADKLGKTWVTPKAGVIKRAAVTDHHLLVEYEDENGETWVTPLKQDDSFFD